MDYTGTLDDVRKQLIEAIDAAKLARAWFDSLFCPTIIVEKDTLICNTNGGGGEDSVTKFIAERTRLYRESWIVGPLEKSVKIIEGLISINK